MRNRPPTSFPSDQLLDRRQVLVGASSLAALFALQCKGAARQQLPHHAFKPVPLSSDDVVRVPDGYVCKALVPWGTPLQVGAKPWAIADGEPQQRAQTGMHHDGMAFFPADGSSTRGILAINHEYTDEGLLHQGGLADWSAAKVAKSKAAVGVSIVELEFAAGEWQVRGGTRITALDRIEFSGPAKAHRLLQTETGGEAWERAGTAVEGTFGNCANGVTPWGTYLTCEENFPDWFAYTKPDPGAVEAMDGAGKLAAKRLERYLFGEPVKTVVGDKAKELKWRSGYGWHLDPRFDLDLAASGNHSNRFGWVLEIDPREPGKRVKRTALGRFRHENAAVVVARDGRVVVYLGDDARFEYIYKFVSKERFEPEQPAGDAAARRRSHDHNWQLLDDGTLYVARFDENGTGEWLELSPEVPAIKASGEFADLGGVVVFARRAGRPGGPAKVARP